MTRIVVIFAALLMLCGCAAPDTTSPDPTRAAASHEADRNGVIAAHEALVRAYETADLDAFVRVLDPSAELLVFHPRLEVRIDGIDEVRQQMPRMFARLGNAEWTDHHAAVSVRGEVAWLTSHVLVESENAAPFVGRGTEIYTRTAQGWKLSHGHWSPAPDS